MPSSPRIDELRRRIENDPASIAFAQLAEEYRRCGEYDDAVRVARAGLIRHPGYLSARVTLGRSLVELGQLAAAETELDTVLKSAPENLAAIRALADIHQRRGEDSEQPRTPEPPAEPEVLPPDRGLDLDLQDFNTALDALDALTLDLPAPGPSSPAAGEFDLATFEIDDTPQMPAASEEWTLDDFAAPPLPPDPALDALEQWLDALVSDRADRRRR